ncbi:hypothetical protein AQUCO_03400259v1 [Aquilegia coerulea]|uniref:NTF2 domain-containing protein n=1 Tax=Aquilegia coerulea TaxID=218851 RepID=A0A2G5CY81_AQUCA|nr:hypothetical protein AQUCO_03400259v1 [Aquilegia coerulea]
MASLFPASVSAYQVGTYFVQQYYQVLQQQPDFVYQFYTDASTMLRIDGTNGHNETATTMLQIHSLIMSLNFSGIEIKTAHSLDSWTGGVLVMVSGSVQPKDYGRRRNFMQTFFLAPQEKGYYVLNDIFHFLDEENIHQHPAAILAHSHFDSKVNVLNPLPEPVSDYMPTREIQTRDFVASSNVEENDLVDNYSFPEQQEQHQALETNNIVDDTPVEELTSSFSHAMSSIQDPSPVIIEEPVGEPQKHTYASILRVAKAQSTAPVAPQRSVKKSAPPTPEWNNAPLPTQRFYPVSAMGSDRSVATEDFITHVEEGEGRSVYVRGLTTAISSFDIEQEFKNFGSIKPDGVAIQNRQDINVVYAFVEFEDAVGARNAINASPVEIAGTKIYIEERRPRSSSTSRGSRGRGRGSYSTDASRGRFGTRNFGRGSADGADKDYSRPRGNGYHRRGATQDRGILGNHVSRNGQNPSDDAAY